MHIKDVTYNAQPDPFEIRRAGSKAVIVFPTNVEEVEVSEEPIVQDGGNGSGLPEIGGGSSEATTTTQYIAHDVYQLETNWTPNLEQRVTNNFQAWLNKAKIPESKEATLADVIEAVNALTEVILGGE